MKILLQREVIVPTKDNRCNAHKAGETVSVYHRTGRRLIMGRVAKWVSAEEGDPYWVPAPLLRAGLPERDKMIRTAVNK